VARSTFCSVFGDAGSVCRQRKMLIVLTAKMLIVFSAKLKIVLTAMGAGVKRAGRIRLVALATMPACEFHCTSQEKTAIPGKISRTPLNLVVFLI